MIEGTFANDYLKQIEDLTTKLATMNAEIDAMTVMHIVM